jgi:hypothetical protein
MLSESFTPQNDHLLPIQKFKSGTCEFPLLDAIDLTPDFMENVYDQKILWNYRQDSEG